VPENRSILLLCDDSRGHPGNVLAHIAALERFSRHDVYRFNPVDRPGSAGLDLGEFDAVVVHYTLYVLGDRYLPRVLRDRIQAFDGLKIQLIQDEYRRVDAVTAAIRELGIDVLYTCMPPAEAAEVYGPRLPGVEAVTTLPGYAPEPSGPAPPLDGRPLDVGYRGRDVPYWLGRLGREKVEIGDGFLARCEEHGLRCDISSREEDRIYGQKWTRFLASSRATLGTESGASIVDFDGSIEAETRRYLVRHPDARFAEVEQAVLAPHEGNVRIAVASPRLFEAASLRTALVMFPGGYSGVVEPWTHYLLLERDFSNLGEVVERLRDTDELTALVDRAYEHVIASGRFSLRRFVGEFDDLVAEHAPERSSTAKPHYERARRRNRLPSLQGHSRLRESAGAGLKPLAALAVIATDGPLRQLAALSLRRRIDAAGDLWRLAALRREGAQVTASLERAGRLLVLTSKHKGERGYAADIREAVRRGSLEAIVWDHTDAGATVPLLRGGRLQLRLGRDGVEGAYSFIALPRLARIAPELVLAALDPVLGKEAAPASIR
jgi:hypothetical protein